MTIKFNNVYVENVSTVAGPFVIEGPLKDNFDKKFNDFYDGEKTFEKCEMKELKESIKILLDKTKYNEEDISFTIEELLKRVNILMKHELKNAIIYLNISLKTDENAIIHGDVNSLVQVINNMVSNSIQAYEGKTEQTIDLIVEKEDNNLLISIKDYASGLPDKVKEKLFKEMITTKGKNGTGLGLYMSYSTIKAHFNGNITVDSELGKGTTFTITLPLQ